MFPIFNIGPLAIQAPGLIILVGLWIWFTLNDRFTGKFLINSEVLSNNFFYSLLIGLVGSRIAFLIQNPRAFLDNPIAIISPNLALFDFTSGIFISILVFLILAQRKNLAIRDTLDMITPGLLIFLAFVSLSFLASGNLYGAPGDLPWSIYLWGTLRHPLQVYYLVLFLLGAGFTIQQIKNDYPSGSIFFLGLLIISLIVLFLEAFRGSPTAMIGNVRIPQMVAFILLLISLRNFKFSNSTVPENTQFAK